MRVLVVEDEIRLAAYLRRSLEKDGYAVDIAHDGEEGLLLAGIEQYDAVLLDIMLPKLNGYRVCAELRAGGNWVPILMLTAKDGEYDEAEALDTGADDYLSKPFSLVVLQARLRALIRRGVPERPVLVEVGDLRLDPARRTFHRGATEILLTPREYAVVEYLMRHAGDVVSKTEILRSVWDWSFEGDPNIVEVYIGHLRRKIDAPFDRSTLQTVRGFGYRLADDGG